MTTIVTVIIVLMKGVSNLSLDCFHLGVLVPRFLFARGPKHSWGGDYYICYKHEAYETYQKEAESPR